MFKTRSQRETEPRRPDAKTPAPQSRKGDSKPQPLDLETLRQVTGGALPRTGGW